MNIHASQKQRSRNVAPIVWSDWTGQIVLQLSSSFFMVGVLGGGISSLVLHSQAVRAQGTPVDSAMAGTQETTQSNQTVLYVNPTVGSDRSNGSERSPLKTITQALQVAQPHMVILLAPGVYSTATGEVFPLVLRPHITIQGNPDTRGQNVVIQGGGLFSSPGTSRNIAILGGANQAALIGVTITNPSGYGIQIISSNPTIRDSTLTGNAEAGIYIAGNSTSLIRNNFFSQNKVSGISIHNKARPTLEDNIFEQNGIAIASNDNANPLIASNRVTQNQIGISIKGPSQPTLRDNSIEDNGQNELRSDAKLAATPDSPSNLKASQPAPTPLIANPRPTANASLPFGTPLPIQPLPASPASPPALPKPGPSWQVNPPAAQSDALAASGFPIPRALLGDEPGLQAPRPKQPAPLPPLTPSPSRSLPVVSAPSALPKPVESLGAQQPETRQSIRSISRSAPNNVIVSTIPVSTATVPAGVNFPTAGKANLPTAIAPAPIPEQAFASSGPGEEMPTILVRERKRKTTGQISIMPVQPTIAPVPKTISSARRLPSPAMPAANATAIDIPVPPPERRNDSFRIDNPIVRSPQAAVPVFAPRTPSAKSVSLLPVPGPNAPIGNVSNMPSVYSDRSGVSPNQLAFGAPSNGGAMVKYRVVVFATNEDQQTQLRALVPNAFPIQYRGQTAMQAGAFGDRSKADQLVTTLSSQGLQTTIEPLQ